MGEGSEAARAPGVPAPGPQDPSGSHPRPCLAYTGCTAFAPPPATPEGSSPYARLGSPAAREALRLRAPEIARPRVPRPGSTLPFTSSHSGRRKDRPICNIQADRTRTLTGRSRTPPGPLGARRTAATPQTSARGPPATRMRRSAAGRFADGALALSRALSLGQWGFPQSRGRLHRSGGAAVSSGRCLAAILCVAESGLLGDWKQISRLKV